MDRVFSLDRLESTKPYVPSGGSFALQADFPNESGNLLWAGMSLATRPGIPLRRIAGVGIELLPLAPDWLFLASVSAPVVRVLDRQGRAMIRLRLPRGINLLGLRLHFAGVTFDRSLKLTSISNAARVEVVR